MHQRCRTARHSPAGFVSSGKRLKRTEVVECSWCGASMVRRAGRVEAPTCSYECRAAWTNYCRGRTLCDWPQPYVAKSSPVRFGQCLGCDAWMRIKHSKVRYCSGQCGSKHVARTGAYIQKRRRVWFLVCSDCDLLYCARSSIQKRCGPCASLHEYRTSSDSSKVHKLIPYIGTRDRWVCQICGKRVPSRTYSHLDRLSPTVDHVVTKSEARDLGWPDEDTHALANLRLAHMICNSRRSNRGGGEQLALVG
jgi:5-methylcytosine-specific restriction endonuclease McrA